MFVRHVLAWSGGWRNEIALTKLCVHVSRLTETSLSISTPTSACAWSLCLPGPSPLPFFRQSNSQVNILVSVFFLLQVAVKVIDKRKAREDPYVAKNMRREAKLMMMVNHPNVLKLLEVVETDNSYYLVTEMAEGGDLMERICSKQSLGEEEVRKYMRQIISAVDHLHNAKIIHRYVLSFGVIKLRFWSSFRQK